MKQANGKPADGIMKFFTPELYLRYNSADEEESDRADADWEKAVEAYDRHLSAIKDKLPADVLRLASTSFHDAVLLRKGGGPPFVFVALKPEPPLEDLADFTLIWYVVAGAVRQRKAKRWPFVAKDTLWLYDEIALGDWGTFLHRILLSDGTELEIPFRWVMIDTKADAKDKSKKSA